MAKMPQKQNRISLHIWSEGFFSILLHTLSSLFTGIYKTFPTCNKKQTFCTKGRFNAFLLSGCLCLCLLVN